MTQTDWQCTYCKAQFSYLSHVEEHLERCDDKLAADFEQGKARIVDMDAATKRRWLALFDAVSGEKR